MPFNSREFDIVKAAVSRDTYRQEQHQDDAAVDALAAAMKTKLAKQRANGYGGWDTPECTQQRLSDMLRAHVDKGDPVDVANFCAFLAARGEGIAQAARPDELQCCLESKLTPKPSAVVGPSERWRERWHGSPTEQGWSIMHGRECIAYLGPDVPSEAVSAIVAAHNAAPTQAAPQPAAVAGAEYELKDVRCECCGYMTYHREHTGCIRAAYAARAARNEDKS